ncbi:DNA gyrase subunit A [Candidatus Woesearchaeota archaeon]|nr:MAG: DNA gyrase subunit A [Candidatus Woesearchaeota archaeon]
MEAADKQNEEQRILRKVIDQEMKQSYLAYSMSVIVGRALPDVRDGLKPVHRRILYAMNDMGMLHNKPFKKSARIVGEVLGKYHPHGDAAVYDSLVRMAQSFSLRYPLIDGQGNFGSIDGDSAAAQRYTEARLKKMAEELLADIDKDTIDFIPNYDNSLKEPSVLPSKAPNLLINGSSGIAVGMATNIPPHNLKEVCKGAIELINNPDITFKQLADTIKGPDFPTGGVILGRKGIKEAYETGKGKIKVRAKTSIEEAKSKQRIVVEEIPYMVNKAHLIEQIANLVNEKKIQGISDIRDESDQKHPVRIVIELKKGVNSDVVLNQLYAHTRMQETFGVIMLALVNNEPKILNIKELLQEFLNHRKTVVIRRTKFELKQAEARAHILEGIITALDHIDDIVDFLKKSKNAAEAKTGLMTDYKFSEKQAQSILDMKLQKLTSLEQEKLRNEHKNLLELIEKLRKILSDEKEIWGIIKEELTALAEEYGDERRTQITDVEAEKISEEELIKEEENVVTMTHAGYVKRLPRDTYKSQKRGGKGIIATETREEDFVEKLFTASTHDYILFFTNKGKVHWLKVYQIPETGRYARGTSIVNLIELGKDERITALVPVSKFDEDKYLFMATRKGTVKKTQLSNFSSPRRGGIVALGLNEGDSLINVLLTTGKDQIILATKKGMAARFSEDNVRPMGRTAFGVIGIKLKGEDEVVGAVVADETKTILTVTEKGYGKRTPIKDYRLIARGGVGVINIKITEKNGNVVGIAEVSDEDDIMFITQAGVLLRSKAKEISVIGRNTQGVRVMRLHENDKLVSLAKIAE